MRKSVDFGPKCKASLIRCIRLHSSSTAFDRQELYHREQSYNSELFFQVSEGGKWQNLETKCVHSKKNPNKTTTTSFISLVTELWHCGVMCILHNCEAIGISAAPRIKEPQIHCQRSRRKMKKKKIKSSRTTLMQKHWWFKSSLGANLS